MQSEQECSQRVASRISRPVWHFFVVEGMKSWHSPWSGRHGRSLLLKHSLQNCRWSPFIGINARVMYSAVTCKITSYICMYRTICWICACTAVEAVTIASISRNVLQVLATIVACFFIIFHNTYTVVSHQRQKILWSSELIHSKNHCNICPNKFAMVEAFR